VTLLKADFPDKAEIAPPFSYEKGRKEKETVYKND
jgi:hypothetical protein